VNRGIRDLAASPRLTRDQRSKHVDRAPRRHAGGQPLGARRVDQRKGIRMEADELVGCKTFGVGEKEGFGDAENRGAGPSAQALRLPSANGAYPSGGRGLEGPDLRGEGCRDRRGIRRGR
jgi:hypothetical protein